MDEPESTTPGTTAGGLDWTTPRPVDETYWVVPGRLLVGAHPGSRSRAQAMDRLRRFLEAGVTCFVDLTEPSESPGYEMLLPFETPTGRRVEYLREPIVDHGVPGNRETMARILAMLDGALESGHLVYLHCRAGIGRSAMAAGCWLAERRGSGDEALVELADLWQQAAQSRHWPRVPETDAQVAFVRDWVAKSGAGVEKARGHGSSAHLDVEGRLRGAWFGAALGDAMGSVSARNEAGASEAPALAWTQHTALALCLAESLLDTGRCDARDQIERYLRWQREGYCSADGKPGDESTAPDVAKALATYLWRGLPMAGSHDPKETAASSLPRVLAAVSFSWRDPSAAVALAAECSRTTHQSPVILECCRLLAAMMICALQGQPGAAWLAAVPQTSPPCWSSKPLRKDVAAMASQPQPSATHGDRANVLHVLAEVRRIVLSARNFDAALDAAARAGGKEAALYGALVGALYGMTCGPEGLPAAQLDRLAGREQLEATVNRLVARTATPRTGA